jgi:hypothetical protein
VLRPEVEALAPYPAFTPEPVARADVGHGSGFILNIAQHRDSRIDRKLARVDFQPTKEHESIAGPPSTRLARRSTLIEDNNENVRERFKCGTKKLYRYLNSV